MYIRSAIETIQRKLKKETPAPADIIPFGRGRDRIVIDDLHSPGSPTPEEMNSSLKWFYETKDSRGADPEAEKP